MSQPRDRNHPLGSDRGALYARGVQWVSMAVFAAACVAVVRGLPLTQGLEAAVAWIEGLGALAPIAFVVLYFLATMLMLPAWPLSVAAGALFGLMMGSAVVVAGATCGAAGAFLLARYLARRAIERRLRHYPRFAAMDRAVGEGGWKIVLLLRLSPAFPFTLQNYVYGLTAIRFWPCVLATAVGIVPGVFLYVYLGAAGRAGIEAAGGGAGQGARTALLVAGLVATLVATAYISRLARDAIKQYGARTPGADLMAAPAPAKPARNPWIPALASCAAAAAMAILAGCIHNLPRSWASAVDPPALVAPMGRHGQENPP